ncbi:hypothetical protein, partial [Stappia sp. MMSF_3263]|uniref:hypothetical protein n=1 Tax=Stappia sp. MMSF_3263 TaxID=3046693 RepID=UPI00273E805A
MFAAERDSAGTTHIVFALYEMDLVFVAAEERQKSVLKVIRRLSDTLIEDDEGRLHARAVGNNLQRFGLLLPVCGQIPVLVIREEPRDAIRNGFWRFWRFGVDPFFKASSLQSKRPVYAAATIDAVSAGRQCQGSSSS